MTISVGTGVTSGVGVTDGFGVTGPADVFPGIAWLLAEGNWNDVGLWLDGSIWNDG